MSSRFDPINDLIWKNMSVTDRSINKSHTNLVVASIGIVKQKVDIFVRPGVEAYAVGIHEETE